ncbi:Pectate lyase [Quillaja saponaria]|uniref:Pectate lyase n=1 Tax=Quillaja saponaria TaxID=32244 RepID=A0AAD7PUX5_QUISA|nr:Pectate lyase [Quillaja saponaria]
MMDIHADKIMRVTIVFNQFGSGLIERMPRVRFGYAHVVNNRYDQWQMYAIGGSANPTILSEANYFIAPNNPNSKEVTKREVKEQHTMEKLEMEIFQGCISKWCSFCSIWVWKLCSTLLSSSIFLGCSRVHCACINFQCRSSELCCWKSLLVWPTVAHFYLFIFSFSMLAF